MTPAGAIAYPIYIIIGVAVGQVAAWIVGAAAAFTNIAGIVAAIFGGDVTTGTIFVVGTATYAIVVGIAASAGLAALARVDSAGPAEALAGVLAGALAFLLTSWLAEPYVRFVIDVVPGAAEFVGSSTGLMAFVAAVLLQAVPIGLLTLAGYVALRAVLHSSAQTGASET
jgi:hypothetical protein